MDEQRVYFVAASESGRVKIGIAGDPLRRMALMQVGSPEVLVLLGHVPGGRDLEERLHRRLSEHRVHGEWFDGHENVQAVIGEMLGWFEPTPQQIESARKADELRAMLP